MLQMRYQTGPVVLRVTGRRNRMLALALHHRDGGLCGRCHRPIPLGLHYTDPQSLTIGHIRPHALGGSYEPDNLRAEHRWCNLTAGMREDTPVANPVTP